MVTYITRAALEIVSQCGLGQSFDPLTVKEHEEHRYISSMKLLGYVMAPLLTPVIVIQNLTSFFAVLLAKTRG
jgi:hypothetical protein